MEVYAFDGSGLIKSLTDGIATSWFPDGKKVLFFLDESLDGHGVSNSDIFIVDVETNEITNLTNTPDVLEMYPSLSPNGKQITYTNSETGVLIIADLK
ncbi:MAG: DPP IV N-terminal domain-containing protein [Flavobacteriales bacterium]|nr:DPP IV N-terminal domain-containing protein [Flavobacteriales bacterium]